MATRPTWQGYLRLSLVSCPVALYTASQRGGEVHFNMLHKDTHNRIRMIPTDPDLGPVDRADIVKGYEIEKGHYVVVTEDEIDNVRLETTRTIDIERFVDETEIDRLYWDDPYYLAPDGDMAVEAFTVIREAMESAGKVALGRVVMHQRERLLALALTSSWLLVYTIRTHDEVRDPDDIFGSIPRVKADPAMIDIAARIIDQQAGPFEPEDFTDRYEEALRDLIRRKEKSRGRTVDAPEPKQTEVSDLMEALRRSLGEVTGGRRKPPARRAAPRKASPKRRAS